MGRYAHPALAEREEIMLMRHEGRSQADIARVTGRDRSTISREMRRNSFRVGAGRCYRASTAQRSYEARRLSCVRPRILDDEGLAGLVTRLIVRERWSPEQIAGRIGVERPDLSVSVSTIYRAVNDGRLDPPELERAKRGIRARLRHRGKRRHRRGGPRAAWRRWAGARSSPTSRGSRRRPARSSTSRCRTIPGSAAPTRTPTAWSASTSPRAPTSTRSATNGFVRCMMRSATGRASAMASGRPTRSTIRRRCTCSENSSPIKPKKSLED